MRSRRSRAVFLARRFHNVHLDLSSIPPSRLLDYLPTLVAGLLMQGRLSALVASYGTQFALSGPGLRGTLLLLAGAAMMGWLGAWLATGHHLRRTRPVDV